MSLSRGEGFGADRHPSTAPRPPHGEAPVNRGAKPSALVRPYAMTGGRTRPTHRLPLEALVSTTVDLSQASGLSPEAYRICILCRSLNSIAEISAILSIPLGVARILVADLAESGFVLVQQLDDGDAQDDRPQVNLLERVLMGLRNLA
ncbi:DUF742 domain-containing protein [Streptomyces aureus]|uniref:DUF742 domain-containing protein n=1 Tax=Streptomyces aureus TaxID=193461 RepID=UPI0036B50979